jgi:hypothetical protein
MKNNFAPIDNFAAGLTEFDKYVIRRKVQKKLDKNLISVC